MDELYLARARYEETLKNDPEFDENLDFVLFRDHGKAIARPYYYFKKLMKKCNIDCTKHVWHDLRHPYVKPTTKKFITFFEAFRAAI